VVLFSRLNNSLIFCNLLCLPVFLIWYPTSYHANLLTFFSCCVKVFS
jgi:hypothetical protein